MKKTAPSSPFARPDLDAALAKVNRASTAAAALPSGPSGPLRAFCAGPAAFLRAWLGSGEGQRGAQGLLYGLLAGYYTFLLHLKIWEQRRKGPQGPPKDKA